MGTKNINFLLVIVVLMFAGLSCAAEVSKADKLVCQTSNNGCGDFQACCSGTDCYYKYEGKTYDCNGSDCSSAAETLVGDMCNFKVVNKQQLIKEVTLFTDSILE